MHPTRCKQGTVTQRNRDMKGETVQQDSAQDGADKVRIAGLHRTVGAVINGYRHGTNQV